ncbi:PaaI family thioesterase [Geminicoccus roseus]|uniref:PaaI family thioesterase n=1 Tax=Geminicoccus roseus TaxID=404900 RepID=UPI000410B9C1|nr:PaaI family thioesterase [Geminicoccus roseus]
MTERKPITLTDGVAAGGSKRSGLEVIQGMIDGGMTSTMATTMDCRVVGAEAGKAVIRAVPNEGFLNLHGTVHGGWAATVLDTALGCAVVTTLDAGQGTATVELSTRFIRPIFPANGPVIATGTVVNRGRRLVVAEGRIVSEKDGKLLAQATGTWAVLESEKT